MSADTTPRATQDDAALESAIEIAVLQFQTAGSIPARRMRWAELQRLIASRSPEQVQWMEERRGLR